ncbi:TIGR03085 family metal-binding protein [Cellulomonas endophytica]|uniref:TIGR03085 family metal-binding protein n=1 Tax=Cellulomonas endophytica TaxID=2494735 RepID=UPI0010107DEE|nr:TIGR03085 family metal-binding protein [Cellulomonas endophytica]
MSPAPGPDPRPWHRVTRRALAAALAAAEPDAPTLCEGWQARHLAAHLVLREHAPLTAAGVVVPALAGRTAARVERLAATAQDRAGYRALVDRVAQPPAALSPFAWLGTLVDVTEHVVHTEDVRRGAGPVPPRVLEPGLTELLWGLLRGPAALALRGARTGVVLVRPDGVRSAVRRPREGHGTVVVHGEVVELLLWLSGRGRAADVRQEGTAADRAALASAMSPA